MSSSSAHPGPNVPEGDWIHLRDLSVSCVLGLYPEERRQPRPVVVNVSLQTDIRPAAASDRIEDALNYELVETAVIQTAREGQFQLIEALAAAIAKACLRIPRVHQVRIVVDKPGALPRTRSVAVEIVRANA